MYRSKLEQVLLCSKTPQRHRAEGYANTYQRATVAESKHLKNSQMKYFSHQCQPTHNLSGSWGQASVSKNAVLNQDSFRTPVQTRKKLTYGSEDQAKHRPYRKACQSKDHHLRRAHQPEWLAQLGHIKQIMIALLMVWAICYVAGWVLRGERKTGYSVEPHQQLDYPAHAQASTKIEYEQLAEKQVLQLIDRLRLEGVISLVDIDDSIRTRFSSSISSFFLESFHRKLHAHRSLNVTGDTVQLASEWWLHCN